MSKQLTIFGGKILLSNKKTINLLILSLFDNTLYLFISYIKYHIYKKIEIIFV
jgi:hypothetical protein